MRFATLAGSYYGCFYEANLTNFFEKISDFFFKFDKSGKTR